MPVVVNRQSPVTGKKPPPVSTGSAWNVVDSLRVLVYGESGTGKTTFWATFPGPILTLLCSGGNKPGELLSIDTPEYRKKVRPVVIQSSEQFRSEMAGAQDYATVVLDHASGYADLLIKELLGLDQIPVGKSRIAAKGESWSLVSQQQYGQMAIMAKESFRELLNLPGNVVIVAQQRTFGGKDEGVDPDLIKPTVGAALTPSLTGWLNPACDYVVQTFKRPRMTTKTVTVGDKSIQTQSRGKGVEYCLRTEPHDVYMTKFRRPKGGDLPECIVDPTYDKLLKTIKGG